MTKDLAGLWEGDTPAVTVTSRDFLLAIRDELQMPVKFIGVGEGIDDLMPFEAEKFVEALV